MNRYTWSFGYRTAGDALKSLWDDIASGIVSQGESPKVEPYRTRDGRKLYRVTLADY